MTATPRAISFVQVGSTDTLVDNITCPLPAGSLEGDFLLAVVETDGKVINNATGFTTLYNTGVANPKHRVFYKFLDAADIAAGEFNFSWASAGQAEVVLETWIDVDPTDPIDFIVSTDSGVSSVASITVPAATVGVDDTVLVGAAGGNSSNGVIQFGLPTNPGPWTSPWNPDDGTGGAVRTSKALVRSEYLTGLPAGTDTGTATYTLSASRSALAWTAGLRTVNNDPALLARIVGVAGTVETQTAKSDSVRLAIGTDQAVTQNVVNSDPVTPDADGWATHAVPAGLTPGGTYYYRVLMTGSDAVEVPDNEVTVGRLRVAPTAATSFAFTAGSCCDATDSPAMQAIAARGDDLFLHLGDFWYADGTGQTLANYQTQMGDKIRAPFHQDVFSTIASAFVPSDHDFGMLNGAVGANQPDAVTYYNEVYRQMLPNTPDPATTGVYHTFAWGRVRFIMLDCRTFKSTTGSTDDASKTMLGATQKQWVKDTIDAATEHLIVLAGDTPWTGPATAGADFWAGYNTERTELADHITASGKNVIYVAGDMHAVAADDGTNGLGIPSFQCSPLVNTASTKAGPYTVGPYPASGTALVRQYGRFDLTDNGSAIALNFTGYDHNDNELLSMDLSFPGDNGAAVGEGVVVGGVLKQVVAESVIVGGVKKPVVNKWVIIGGIKKALV